MKTMLIAAAFLGLAALPASAADPDRAQDRSAWQQERIGGGIAQGQVTPGEATRLERGQARVSGAEARAAQDGVVTRGEARHINNMQNRQSRHIYRARHNGRTA